MKSHRIQRSKGILLLVLVSLAISVSGCDGENQKDLIRALIASCGDRTVFLNSWWSNVDNQSLIEVDPMGGYIFLYWIDEDGNACHGEPGVSGQPGPFVVSVFDEGAFSAGREGAEISVTQLKRFQFIPFNLGSYTSGGMHFAQFSNTIWRERESGSAWENRSNLNFAIPEIVSLDLEFCLVPINASGQPECGPTMLLPLPSIHLSDEPDQHPDMCSTRVMPDTISLATSERLDYCVLGLPHGFEITD